MISSTPPSCTKLDILTCTIVSVFSKYFFISHGNLKIPPSAEPKF